MDHGRVSVARRSLVLTLLATAVLFCAGCSASTQTADVSGPGSADQRTAQWWTELSARLTAIENKTEQAPDGTATTSVLSGWAKTTQVFITTAGTGTALVILILFGQFLDRRMAYKERMAIYPLINTESNWSEMMAAYVAEQEKKRLDKLPVGRNISAGNK